MKGLVHFSIVGLTLLLSACASGPKLSEISSTLAKIPEEQGRVYFYRTQLFGLAVQPSINLNGETVGSCVPSGVFFKDVPPGNYKASTETEVERQLTFTMSVAEQKYVRCYISLGLLVGRANLELVSPSEAKEEIDSLTYTGK